MIGIDTNLLLRLVLRDDLHQMMKVERFLADASANEVPIFINRMVLCETVWILSRTYRLPKQNVIATVETLLETEGLMMDAEDAVREALEAYRAHNVDFIDLFIAATNHGEGAAYTATFDKKAAAIPAFRLLK